MKNSNGKGMAAGSMVLLLVAGVASADTAVSAAAAAGSPDVLDEVIVTGTRQTGLKAADSPAPIQILSADTLQKSPANRI